MTQSKIGDVVFRCFGAGPHGEYPVEGTVREVIETSKGRFCRVRLDLTYRNETVQYKPSDVWSFEKNYLEEV